MSTLETQHRNYLKENPNSTFTFDEWKEWHGNQLKQAITNMKNKYKECKPTDFYDEQDPRGMSTSEYDTYMKAKEEQKQHIVDLMEADEELGLYEEETVEEYFLSSIKNMLQFNNDALAIRFMEKYYHAKKEEERSYREVFEWLANKDYLSDNVELILKEFEQFKNK